MTRKVYFSIQIIVVIVLFLISATYIYRPDMINNVIFGVSESKKTQNSKRNGKSSRALPVIVKRVTKTPDTTIIEAIGDGRAHKYITLYPEASGEVVSLSVKGGDTVNKDEVILRLDTRKTVLAVEIARTRLLEAKRKLDRIEKLLKSNVSSKANVDDARTSYKRANLELEQAQEAFKDRTIRAPFKGVLGIPKVETGDRVTSSTDIVTLDDRSVLNVEFVVPEYFLPQLKIGQKLVARTPGFSTQSFTGKISDIDSRIDTTSRAIKVRANLPNTQDLLRPGMSFAIQIKIPGKLYPTIPELALQWEQGNSYVWRISDNKAEKVNVLLVKRINSNILVKGALAENDIVVIEGVQRLRPGSKVTFKAPEKAKDNSIKQARGR